MGTGRPLHQLNEETSLMQDNKPSITRAVVTILEREPDGTARAFHYRLSTEMITLLMDVLGPPSSVMYLEPSQLDDMSRSANSKVSDLRIERVDLGGPCSCCDHMPEAMWPPEERWPGERP